MLVPDPYEKKNTRQDIEDFFNRKVEDLYGKPEYKLEFQWMDEIPPDPNGKMRCFIRDVE